MSDVSWLSVGVTLTEAHELWRAERRALKIILGWGRLNEKMGRYYQVRSIALGRLVSDLFCGKCTGQ